MIPELINIYTKQITTVPFSFDGGQETVNAGFIFFTLVSIGLFYSAITRSSAIVSGINFLWFITWTALFYSAGFTQIFMLVTFIAGVLPLFLGEEDLR